MPANNENDDELIRRYITDIAELKRLAVQNSEDDAAKFVTSVQFDNYVIQQFFHELQQLHHQERPAARSHNHFTRHIVSAVVQMKNKWFVFLVSLVVGLIIGGYYKSEACNLFMSYIQPIIYPGMSVWRQMTAPIVANIPGLSQLYDETCLLSNPFFHINDMDCRPCADVVNILDVTNVTSADRKAPATPQAVPYMFQTMSSSEVDLIALQQLYEQHRNVFRTDAYTIRSTNVAIQNLDDLFEDFLNSTDDGHRKESHNLWRCNRMNPLRLLRTLLVHPVELPRTGLSIERFLAIDSSTGPAYEIPETECSSVFVYQVTGVRTMIMRPTNECQGRCRTISVRLAQSYVCKYRDGRFAPPFQ